MMLYDVLKASKGLYVDDEYAMLWGKQLGGWTVSTITGTLPMTFRSNGSTLINYRIYGTADGAGVQTKNLFDPDNAELVYGFFGAGSPISAYNPNTRTSFVICEPNTTYTVCKKLSARFSVSWSESEPTNGVAIYGNVYENDATNITITTGATAKYLVFYYFHASYDTLTEQEIRDSIMIVKGSTPPETYIPHGYKLPLTTTSGTESKDTDIYIGDSKLLSSDYVDYESGKIVRNGIPQDPPLPLPAIETFSGENTLDSTETLGEVTIKGMIKEAE